MFLAKSSLAPDVIDVAIGEPDVIGELFLKIFEPILASNDISALNVLSNPLARQYPYPAGYPDLVEFLEKKHQAQVVITNGAKQALSAALFAVKQVDNIVSISLRNPYWALLPPLIESIGLKWHSGPDSTTLLVAPNNPDGWIPDNIPNGTIIHDGVYYSNIYCKNIPIIKSDLQIFSYSKYFGIPGIRLGYVVCHNPKYYQAIVAYLEATTVGVSSLSQVLVHELLTKSSEKMINSFEKQSSQFLQEAKDLVSNISSQVLEVPSLNYDGMFAWCKIIDPEKLKISKINMAEGTPFGQPGFVRINLAVIKDSLQKMVLRLNS